MKRSTQANRLCILQDICLGSLLSLLAILFSLYPLVLAASTAYFSTSSGKELGMVIIPDNATLSGELCSTFSGELFEI